MSLVRGTTVLLLASLFAFPPQAAADAPRLSTTLLPGIGMRIETIGNEHGPVAYRTWLGGGAVLPTGDAVLLEEAWWTPIRTLEPVPEPPVDPRLVERIRATVAPAGTRDTPDRLIDHALGDVDLDGTDDLVISHRRPFRRTAINISRPRRAWTDEHGLSAHVGLYRPDDLSEMWVAGTLTSPVMEVAACNGGLAVAYGHMRKPGVAETGAWRWVVFGFLPTEPLPGAGTPTCVDLDRDGRTEPAITGRSEP